VSQPDQPRPDLRTVALPELQRRLAEWNEPAFRAGQILAWLYQQPGEDWESMTNLPRRLRQRLAAEFSLALPELSSVRGSRDSTAKFLWRLRDGAFLESVLIPASEALYGEPSDRRTLCVSTQVGCAYGCRFCASGLDGFRRNLGVEEIVGQVLAVERWWRSNPASDQRPGEASSGGAPEGGGRDSARPRVVGNLVVMGMGEPLANYENLLKALRILNAPWGGAIGARKITVSTSGLAPQIRRLAQEPEQFRLAVSLHAATDAVRDRLMPVNRKYALAELLAACDHYVRRKGRMITLEYILIAKLNDDPTQAAGLARIAGRLGAKVNLIPYNHVEELPWDRPEPQVQERFLSTLLRQGVMATLRREKGGDIEAACGQLRLLVERVVRTAAGTAAAACASG